LLAKDQVDQPFGDRTIDSAEITRFENLAEEWWNPHGKFRAMHSFNNTRRDYIIASISRAFGLSTNEKSPLTGLKILDVGCGGGLISEPLAILGAHVVGVDATAKNIEIAKRHASDTGVFLDYRHGTASSAVGDTETFDVVLNLEVVEHVMEPKRLIKDCAALVRPGGLMIVATLNRTVRSFALAILGAEYVLRWLPRGTHQWGRFLKPTEISKMLSNNGLAVHDITGVTFNPLTREWKVSENVAVNYLLVAKKPGVLTTKGYR
jgi:2-polyprenyl-6-hydroxyphenyl methylase/3-demethylubiquinone-9 3-methyltransferase